MKRALITDDCHMVLVEGLETLGFKCDYRPEITPEEVFACIPAYDGLIVSSKIWVNDALLARASRLQFIGRLGSGMEIIDREAAAARGIAVVNSPEGNRNAVAEHALGMLLALLNNLLRADKQVRQGLWQREANRGIELSGKTVGIIGFGHTGSQFARKLAGLEVRVLAYDKYKSNYAADMPWVQETELEVLQKEADIISLHIPLTQETHHLVNTSFFRRCKPGLIIINTSRGACIKTADLVEALEAGQVGGACLDVFENERPETFTPEEVNLYERLYRHERVVLTPHIAGWTHESKQKLAEVLLKRIKELLER
ncbi:MAG: NAD(P)-binding domain-containing protein [Saprospiraceae bacterium]|nr:NAD(P)-binding domain-containing protein [Saprospiraceae bacterium]MDW8483390.1 NAD(P)-dependent oxidoreductase [Saprospiraceae bacterium]